MPTATNSGGRHSFFRRARKVRAVITVAVYTVLAPFGYVGFATLCAIPTADATRRARRLQFVTSRAYRLMFLWLRVMRITRFSPRWPIGEIPEGPCVVVANHPTLMDVTGITAVLGGGCTIVKPELYRRPMLRPLLDGAGHIEGPGADPHAVGQVVDTAVQRLHDGLRLIIFPEGTRSPEGGLRRFGRTPFEIACRAKVPVVSIGVQCDPVFLSKETPIFDPPHPVAELRLQVLAIDEPAGVDYDSRALRRSVEERFRSWFAAGKPLLCANRTLAEDLNARSARRPAEEAHC